MPGRGRPRLTPADYQDRLQAYCRRHGVTPNAAGMAPFPSGRRETDQHREWLGLYKAHARLRLGGAAGPEPSESSADGSCGVCGRAVEAADAVVHRSAGLHAACHAVVALVEPLGPSGLDRLRGYLWPPAQSNRSPRRQRKPGRTSSPSR